MFPLLLNKAVSALWPNRPRSANRLAPRFLARGRKRINLALQGGGAHGAFTWGVIDQLLADNRLLIDGISGTSAGAVNAVVLADGLARRGPEEARRRLAEFWRAASFDGALPDLQRAVAERLFSFVPRLGSPSLIGAFSQVWSPYDLNPLNINSLKELIEHFVDFDLIHADIDRELFISATNVRTGEPRVFSRAEINAEAVMASACLPLLFRAVEIDGEAYWDGGYSSNPAPLPLARSSAAGDILIVQINPRRHDRAPVGAREIMSRANDITFNASLIAELRTLKLINQLIDQGRLSRSGRRGEYRRTHLHRIVMTELGDDFRTRSKLSNDYEFFTRLRKLGQRAAHRFLDAHFDAVGVRSTIDLPEPQPAAVA
jgi:NTE family protein